MSSLMTYLGQVANVCYQRDNWITIFKLRLLMSTTSNKVFRFK
nr:MAG TPA: hypothetical protein [Caudoviricetes sp.]